MDYFRVSKFNGYSGPMFGVEYTQNEGESWITTSVHSTQELAEREMRSYVALHRDKCALWEDSLAQKIHRAKQEVSVNVGAEIEPQERS